jgi:hypothetical protein
MQVEWVSEVEAGRGMSTIPAQLERVTTVDHGVPPQIPGVPTNGPTPGAEEEVQHAQITIPKTPGAEEATVRRAHQDRVRMVGVLARVAKVTAGTISSRFISVREEVDLSMTVRRWAVAETAAGSSWYSPRHSRTVVRLARTEPRVVLLHREVKEL